MGEYDELIEMGELVARMGETPPGAEDLAAPVRQEQMVDHIAEVEVTPDYSGGLESPLDDTRPQALDLDAILGVKPREPAPVTPPAAAPATATDSRISELADDNRRLKEQNDMLLRRALGHQPEELETPAPDGGPEELNPEVAEFMKPYVEKYVAERLAPVEKLMAPMVEEAQDAELTVAIAERVPGFTAEDMKSVRQAYNTMTNADKALYGNGLAGAVLLARDLGGRGALPGNRAQPRVNPLTNRHHTESGGARAQQTFGEVDEAEKVARLMALPSDQFLRILDRIGEG